MATGAETLKSTVEQFATAGNKAFKDNIEKSMAALQRIPKTGSRMKVEEANRFIGLDAYQKVLDSGIDVVEDARSGGGGGLAVGRRLAVAHLGDDLRDNAANQVVGDFGQRIAH